MSVYIPPIAETNLRKINTAIHHLAQGGSNNAGTFTLRANQTTTLTSFVATSPTSLSRVFWQPQTADAAAQMATMWCSGPIRGQFTINHAANTSTDQNFIFEVRG